MIKCFIVKNINSSTPERKFEENRFYIAKISSNGINTVSVLDKNKTWVPFKWRGMMNINYMEKYFDIWDEFLVENKKELNEYVPTTKFYKDIE